MKTEQYLKSILAGTVSVFALASAAAAANQAGTAPAVQPVQEINLTLAKPDDGKGQKKSSADIQDQQPGATVLVRLAQAGGGTTVSRNDTMSTEAVTVTGSRITNGSAMPTPVTVVSVEQ
jgi:hypothetical protein